MPEQTEEKPKIKLSELTDMYDIENDIKDTQLTPEQEKSDYDFVIKVEDKKLEEEFD